MYFKGLPPGQYQALYRMRIAEFPATNTPVASLDANPQFCGHSDRQVMSGEFKQAGVYQDVPLRFVVGPDAGYVDWRVFWNAKVTAWVDTITIVEEEIYSNEIHAYFE